LKTRISFVLHQSFVVQRIGFAVHQSFVSHLVGGGIRSIAERNLFT